MAIWEFWSPRGRSFQDLFERLWGRRGSGDRPPPNSASHSAGSSRLSRDEVGPWETMGRARSRCCWDCHQVQLSWAQSGFMTASPAVPRQAVILTLASSLESLPAGCVAVGTRLWGLISMMASPVGRGLCQAGRSDRQKEARLQSLAMR